MPELPLSAIHHLNPPDLSQARLFLSALDPSAVSFLFAIVKTSRDIQVSRSDRSENTLRSLSHWNKEHWNVYVTVNETGQGSGTSRRKEDVSRYRAIFADDDGKNSPTGPYPLEPSIVIESSPGKKQVYWLMADQPPTREEWDGVQQCIVNKWGGDAQARDAARILRVPGFFNSKPEYSPAPKARLLEVHPERRYQWADIIKAFPPEAVTSSLGHVKGEGIDFRAALEKFVSGENYHQAGISLAGYFYNKGIRKEADLLQHLQSLMDISGLQGDPRFDHRRNEDIPATVAWIIKERKREEGPELTDIFPPQEHSGPNKYTRLPRPGGGLWKVTQWVQSIMRYPNEAIAIIVAEHLISVFGGGHYHIMNNTTTRKRIVLAPLGSGKNTITRAVGLVVRGLGSMNGENLPWCLNAELFLGSDSFSFSVQHKQMEQHRVRSFVVNEAGESGRSKSGDIDNLRAYQLQALSTKADEVFIPKKFSEQGKGQEDKQLVPVYNGVWVYFHESTVRSYAEMLTNSAAFVNGDLSRSDIFFIDPTIKEVNATSLGLTPEILSYFSNLTNDMRRLPGVKGSEDHPVWEEVNITAIESRLKQIEQEIIKKRNSSYSQEDEVGIAMLGRRFERILTSVLVCAVADAGGTSLPVAKEHHLDYAIRRANAIDAALEFHSRSGGELGDDRFQAAEQYFVERFQHTIKAMSPGRAKRLQMAVGSPQTSSGVSPGDFWQIRAWTLDKVIKGKAFTDLKNMYNGDSRRARRELLASLADKGIVSPVMERVGEAEFKPVRPPKWWLDKNLFQVDGNSAKIRG